MKGNRILGWFRLWALWTLSTLVGWMCALGVFFSFGGLESPSTITLDGLLIPLCEGAMAGFFIGALVGWGQWLRSRNPRTLILSVLMIVVVTAFLCSVVYISGVLSHRAEAGWAGFLVLGLPGVVGGWVAGLLQWESFQARVRRAGPWILISPVSWAIAFALLIESLALREPLELWGVLLPLVGGLVAGMLQWMVLRHDLKRAGWWIPATSVGWGLAGLFPPLSSPLLGGVFIGVTTATALAFLLSLQSESVTTYHPLLR